MDLVNKIKANKKTILILLLIFVLAFGVRAHMSKYDLLFGFDSYFHTKIVGEVIKTGAVPDKDFMAYWQSGGSDLPDQGQFFWIFNALVYSITTLGAAYSKELWIQHVKFLPAIYGALTAVGLYFVGKNIYGKRAGFAMAFFAAIVPSFVYRTMSGFFEEDSLGFLWMVIGLGFLTASLKKLEFNKRTAGYAVASGVFFGIMALTWEMFLLIPMVLVGYLVFALINVYNKRSKQELFNLAKLFGISFGIFALIASVNDGGKWINRSISYVLGVMPEGIGLLLLGGLVLFGGLVAYIMFVMGGDESKDNSKWVSFVSLALMFLILLAFVGTLLTVNDFRGSGLIESSVGEESTGKESFGRKYNALIALPIIALLLIPLRMFREPKEHLSGIVFFWILITFFMAWYKLKFTFTFGLPIAASAGFVVAEMSYYLNNLSRHNKMILSGAIALILFIVALPVGIWLSILLSAVFLTAMAMFFSSKGDTIVKAGAFGVIGLLMINGIVASAIFVEGHVPMIESNPDYKAATAWLKESTPEGSTIMNWWDEGHWISFLAERPVFTDNRNLDQEAASAMAEFIITKDINKAFSIVDKYKPDYILIDSDNFQKQVSLAYWAYWTTNSQDPRIVQHYGVPTLPYGGINFYCNLIENDTAYRCGANTIPVGQMSSISTDWQKMPTTTQNNDLLWYYRAEDNSEIFFLSKNTNESAMAKLWFHEPEMMKHFEEVYSFKGVKIFKVK